MWLPHRHKCKYREGVPIFILTPCLCTYSIQKSILFAHFNKAQKKCMASIMHFSILLSYRSYRLLPKLYRVDSTKNFLAFHDEPYC